MSAGQDDLPRAQVVRYAEMLLASGMQEDERHILYRYLPSSLCEGIKDPGACSADARILLDPEAPSRRGDGRIREAGPGALHRPA